MSSHEWSKKVHKFAYKKLVRVCDASTAMKLAAQKRLAA